MTSAIMRTGNVVLAELCLFVCILSLGFMLFEGIHIQNKQIIGWKSINKAEHQEIHKTRNSTYLSPLASNSTAVIILTYMRSGSSLTGDILQQNPDVFYLYEPFHSLHSVIRRNGSIEFLNGTKRFSPLNFHKEAQAATKSLLQCDFKNVFLELFKGAFLGRGIKPRTLRECLKERKSLEYDKKAYDYCLSLLRKSCLESKVRAFKTIRLYLSDIVDLYREMPNLKIVHLIRDPRATLASQKHAGKCNVNNGGIYGCTDYFCRRLENDLLEFEQLEDRYLKRWYTLRYEDLASNPINASQAMYDFVGMNLSSRTKDYIYNITSAGKADGCSICSVRSNSTEHIDSWEMEIKPDFLEIIQGRCHYVMKKLGYKINENLRIN